MSKKIQIRSEKLEGAEVSWFAPICDGDDRYLGERNIKYKSNWKLKRLSTSPLGPQTSMN